LDEVPYKTSSKEREGGRVKREGRKKEHDLTMDGRFVKG